MSSASPNRFPQLDGLRALAILAMLAHHWLPSTNPTHLLFHWGGIGIQTMFVLSGFLVTGILLRMKRALDAGATTRPHCLKQFYARRAIRIIPVYFLVLLTMAALNYPAVRQGLPWHLPFLTNFQVALGHQPPGPHPTMIFWTLAVEEQFYLFWPILIFLVPPRFVLPTILLSILAAPASCYLASLTSFGGANFSLMMPACLHLLGSGALLAVTEYPEYSHGLSQRTLERLLLFISLPSLLAFAILEYAHCSAPWFLWSQALLRGIVVALFFAFIVSRIARGLRGPLGRALQSRPLAPIGRISYGIYAYHTFVAYSLTLLFTHPQLLHHLGLARPDARAFSRFFFIRLAALLILAALSWRFLEHPINRLKHRFPYPKAPRPATPVSLPPTPLTPPLPTAPLTPA